MKKIMFTLIALVFSLFLPLLSFAINNPFLQLVHSATTGANEDCGATSDPSFCTCFTAAIIAGCNSYNPHPRCDGPYIKEYIDNMFHDNYAAVCHKFPPQGIDPAVCVTDLQYWHDDCPI